MKSKLAFSSSLEKLLEDRLRYLARSRWKMGPVKGRLAVTMKTSASAADQRPGPTSVPTILRLVNLSHSSCCIVRFGVERLTGNVVQSELFHENDPA